MSVNSMVVCILANILYVPADRVFIAIHMAVVTENNVFCVCIQRLNGLSVHIWSIFPLASPLNIVI